jgi:hypothetical protein
MIPLAPILAAVLFVKPHLGPVRAERFARDVAREAATLDEGFALVATAVIESGLRDEVGDCRVVGDNGRAWSYFQLNADVWKDGHTKKEICTSNPLATRLALRALRSLGGSSGHWSHALRAYVGTKNARDVRVAARIRVFRALVSRSVRSPA